MSALERSPEEVPLVSVEEVFAHALRGERCLVEACDDAVGGTFELPTAEWTRRADHSDRLLVDLCVGATLDVGCGPGRLTEELTRRGQPCLGIDLVAEAVTQTVGRGGTALRRDVFDRLPGEGRWETVLLADGNIGIGGDPRALLERVRSLLAPGGRVVIEVDGRVAEPPEPRTGPHDVDSDLLGSRLVRLVCECGRSEPFRWAFVHHQAAIAVAEVVGLRSTVVHTFGDRMVVVATSDETSSAS